MPDSIDPYRDWLDISDPTRPLDHYRLLGLDPLEPDPERIENAGMIQMGKVLRFDSVRHSRLVQRIYDELENAVRCLSNPDDKQRYDETLRNQSPDDLAEHLLLEPPDPYRELLHEVKPSTAESAAATSPAASSNGPVDEHPAVSPEIPRSPATQAPPQPDRKPKSAKKKKPRRRSDTEGATLAPSVWKAGLLAVCAPLLAWFFMSWLVPGANQETADAYLHLLEAGEPATRIEACEAMGRLGVTPSTTDALLKLLRGDQDVEVRRAAASALSRSYGQLGASRAELAEVAAAEEDSQTRQLLEWTVSESKPK